MHAGHRSRMLEKLNIAEGSLTDHELLEIFLYSAYPRVNTNPIAHRLLAAFGSIEGIFNADIPSLMQVEGVGKACASYIAVNARLLSILKVRQNDIKPSLKNFSQFKEYLINRFKNTKNEEFIVILLNKRYKILTEWRSTDFNENSVNIDLGGLSKLIGMNRPYSAVAAHNHISGDAAPTKSDDAATASIALILSVSGVQFYDHIIVADKDVYSYFLRGRLKEISQQFNIKSITEKIENGDKN